MITFLISTIIAITLLIVFDRQIREQSRKHLSIRIIKYIFVALIGAFTIFSLVFTVGEVAANDMSGFSHLIPLIPLGIIAYLLLRK